MTPDQWSAVIGAIGMAAAIFTVVTIEGEDSWIAAFFVGLIWPISLPIMWARAIRRKAMTGRWLLDD